MINSINPEIGFLKTDLFYEDINGVTSGWRVYITHADAKHLAQEALDALQAKFPGCSFEVHPLSPAFITQGGPGCVAVQVIKDC